MSDSGEKISVNEIGIPKEKLRNDEFLRPFFEEQVSKDNGIDQSLLNGISGGMSEKDEQ